MHYSKLGLVLLVFAIFVSSFSLPCFSSYPLPEHHHDSTNVLTNSLGDDRDKEENNYGYGKVILTPVVHSTRFQSTAALAPTPSSSSSSTSRVINVDSFLRKGRKGDHTKAFRRAWKKACSIKGGVFLVPRYTYRIRPIKFSGPCQSHFVIKIRGRIEASVNTTHYKDRRHWLVFENLRNFKVEGGGTIDGNGKIWWENSCKINKTKPCQHAPTAVTFFACKNFIVDGLRITNAQQMHLAFQRSTNVRASNLVVKSPQTSPNTDGIHVTATRYIQITRSLIQTGDDCISIVDGSKNVQATDIVCGPGHGISIGSLGKGHSDDHVSDVLVNRARLSGTTNGVRIKTWQGGQGFAKNIIFQDIVMNNVSNPIIIDQHYCDQKTPCQEMKSAVHVDNVIYKNIRGTSATKVAIKIDCSKSYWCKGVVLQNVNLVKTGDKEANANCQNVKLVHRGVVSPPCFPED